MQGKYTWSVHENTTFDEFLLYLHVPCGPGGPTGPASPAGPIDPVGPAGPDQMVQLIQLVLLVHVVQSSPSLPVVQPLHTLPLEQWHLSHVHSQHL